MNNYRPVRGVIMNDRITIRIQGIRVVWHRPPYLSRKFLKNLHLLLGSSEPVTNNEVLLLRSNTEYEGGLLRSPPEWRAHTAGRAFS